MTTPLPAAAEVVGVEGRSGGAGAGAVAAMELNHAMEEEEITVKIGLAVLHCPLCFLPLKPPIFECEIGHLACGACRARLPTKQCRVCARGAGSYRRRPGLDVFFRGVKVPCPFDTYGCRRRDVTYFDAADHARACPRAPCACPEPGCAFVGAPATLVGHVDAAHARPATPVRYGAARSVSLPASRRWHVLVAEDEDEDEDEAVFLLTLTELGAGAAVSLACVRANSGAAAVAQYACRLAVDVHNDAGDGVVRALVMESNVGSTALLPGGGAAAPDVGVFVHKRMLSGDTLDLSVRISRLPPAGAVVAGDTIGKSTPVAHHLGGPSCKLAVIRT
ncbi:hypothetical protein PR202_gb26605 [Eleusine coracana subsp. coracana]|uniref:RING-type E3 ubiquitin transferase n=1 Tax=Eleusine coracana subsp. coracana TaxID=191504 RepID=A0AAV5FRK3_ELECO|nr:hypothetical protein PR202_gb26605 [Eleusine coracana subsp. coracana]